MTNAQTLQTIRSNKSQIIADALSYINLIGDECDAKTAVEMNCYQLTGCPSASEQNEFNSLVQEMTQELQAQIN
jgi:hypothetical protein